MKRTLSLLLSLLMILSLFAGLSVSAAEKDVISQGADADLAETGDVNVDVTTAAQLKAALEANDADGVTRYIRVQNDITQWLGVKGDSGAASYVKTWCTLGKGKKVLYLMGHKLTFENDFAVTTAYPDMVVPDLYAYNTLTLFSIPQGAELNVSVSFSDTSSAIWYNGKIIKNKDGIDNRDIFHVDGGKLIITNGTYSTDYRTQVYDYGFFSALRTHRLQVNGTPVTVNAGEAVISGGYFEGRGFGYYFYAQSPSVKKPLRNGAVKFNNGKLIINGGRFYGDNGAIPIQNYAYDTKKLVFNGGQFSLDGHDAHIGTEKGEDCENTGCIGLYMYMPIDERNYNSALSYYDDDHNYYSYQDAKNDKIYKLDDSNEVNLFIEPETIGTLYDFTANGNKYHRVDAGDHYNYELYRWDQDEDLELRVVPESMSFFGAYGAGQRLSAKVSVYRERTSSYIIEKAPVTVVQEVDGSYRLDLDDFIKSNIINQMSYEDEQYASDYAYIFNFVFTESQDYSRGSGKKTYVDVDHLAVFKMLYKKASYTLTVDPHGGMGASYTTTVAKGDTFTLPECKFGAPEGEEFDCWEIVVSETGRRYGNPGESYTPKGNDTIRATWRSVYSTVTLQANNGTGETKELKVLRGGKLTLPPCDFAAPEGTTFYNWQTLDQYGMQYYAGDEITVTKNMTLQANWLSPPNDIALMNFNITAPEIGAHPVNTCTSVDPDRYYAKFHQWFIMENGRVVEYMSSSDVFEAGKSYAFGIDIKVLKGRKTEDTKIYIGGKEAKSIAPSICEYFSVFTMPAVVDKIEVSFTQPVAGEHPDYNAVVPENEYYHVSDYTYETEDFKVYNGVEWYDATASRIMTPSDTFIAGHTVFASVDLNTYSPHTFAAIEELDIGDMLSFRGHNERWCCVNKDFTVEGEKYPVWLGETQVCEENCDDIFGDGRASYDPETYTLTLDYPTIEGYARYEDYYNVDILSQDIDLTVKGGYTMPSQKDNAWLGVAAIGGTLTLDGDFTFYGGNAAIWGSSGVYLVSGDITAEGNWCGISAAGPTIPIFIHAGVDRVYVSDKKQGYSVISGELNLSDKLELVESDNGYQPGGSYYAYRIYEKKGSELETGNFSIDDPVAGMTLPTGEELFDKNIYMGVTDEDYGYINGLRWHDADDNVLPADYVPQSGETVYLDIMLKPAGDNVFSENTTLTVNGTEVACQLVAGRYLMADNIAFTVGGTAAKYLLGDADGDGEVSILDATCVQRHLAELPTQKYVAEAADADGDGEVSILDATAIQRHLAELPTNKNIGKPIA